MAKTSDNAERLTLRSDTPCAASTFGVEPDDPAITIADDLPSELAIISSEIDAIERYMSDILDVVLGSCAAGATGGVRLGAERKATSKT